MRLTITCEIDPGDQEVKEIRARLKGHASVIRRLIRIGDQKLGIESFVLAKWSSENNPRLTRITWKVDE